MAAGIRLIKPSKLLTHIIAWAVVFLLPYLFISADSGDGKPILPLSRFFLYLDTITKIFWVGLFYLNIEILIPRLVYKKKYILYVLIHIGLFCIIMLLHGMLFNWLIPGKIFNFFRSSFHNSLAFLFTIMVSIAYKTINDRTQSEKEAQEKKEENLKTELSFLRSQISPHFLFNVMNNIAAMVRLKSDELEPTIHKLSSLMQYMLYETDEEKVLLQSEMEYLQSYIDLQRQRFSEKLILHASFDVQENWQTIEPMLLIPFVENAFKHGTGMLQNPEIHIQLSVKNNQLDFTVKNKFIENDTVKDKTSGIGLANVKRRLELLYGERHHLDINKRDGWFTASLQLTFKS